MRMARRFNFGLKAPEALMKVARSFNCGLG